MKIAYLMHIPWGWAKQRPHFLALELAKTFSVDVYCVKSYRKGNQTPEFTKELKVNELFVLPFGNKLKLLFNINLILIRYQLKNLLVQNVDFVWLTSPMFTATIPKVLKGKIIYDCMDDFLEFPLIKKKKWLTNIYRKAEHELIVQITSAVFFSSDVLKNRILKRYTAPHTLKTLVVNNAIKDIESIASFQKLDNESNSMETKIIYIGTISSWFDFDIITSHLKVDKGISYHLYGPIESTVPKIKGLNLYGPIAHNEVFKAMNEADILVMPFLVNDLIRAVNPVKLYEYIFTGKPVLAPKYEESEKFGDFVYLYETTTQYFEIIGHLKASNYKTKRSKEECFSFVKENTWANRSKVITETLSLIENI